MRYGMLKSKLGAPAAMILAAAVTTAVSSDTIVAHAQPGFTWATHAGAPLTAKNARAFLAHEAANQIRTLDRIAGAASGRLAPLDLSASAASREIAIANASAPSFDHTISTHQHAAP
jgi:hypothetical protein